MKKICVVIPVCAADEELCRLSIELGIHFGGAKDFPCLLVTSADNPIANREGMIELLKRCFASVSELIIPDRVFSRKRPWPEPENVSFVRTCQYFAWMEPRVYDAFYYKEADVWPLRSSWMYSLAEEYSTCNKPFMGVVTITPDAKGNAGRPHMNGAAFYPVNALLICPEIVLALDTPWDVLIGPRIIGECHDVKDKLMIAEFRTRDFKQVPFGFSCTQTVIKLEGKERISEDRIVEKLAVNTCVWHGCKDRSLYDLLMPKPTPPENIPVDVKVEIPYVKPVAEPINPRLERALEYAEKVKPKKRRARRISKDATTDRPVAGDAGGLGVSSPGDGVCCNGVQLQCIDGKDNQASEGK